MNWNPADLKTDIDMNSVIKEVSMICPNCIKKINKGTTNRRKSNGVVIHKLCPGRISYRKKNRDSNKQAGGK